MFILHLDSWYGTLIETSTAFKIIRGGDGLVSYRFKRTKAGKNQATSMFWNLSKKKERLDVSITKVFE